MGTGQFLQKLSGRENVKAPPGAGGRQSGGLSLLFASADGRKRAGVLQTLQKQN